MKIRHGFVSNSSSSSFVVGIINSNPQKCEHCGRGGVSLDEYMKFNPNDDESSWDWLDPMGKIKGLKHDVKDCHERGWSDDAAWYQETIELIYGAMDEYDRVVGLNVGMHDDALQNFLREAETVGEIKILKGEC